MPDAAARALALGGRGRGAGRQGGLEGPSTLRPGTPKTAWGRRLRPPHALQRPTGSTGPGNAVPRAPLIPRLETRRLRPRLPTLPEGGRSYGGGRRGARTHTSAPGEGTGPSPCLRPVEPGRHGRSGMPRGGCIPLGLDGDAAEDRWESGPALGLGPRGRRVHGRPPGTLAPRARRRGGRWRCGPRLQGTGVRGGTPDPWGR